MLISLSKRVLFIHVPRTGGSSVRNLLHGVLPDAESFLGQHDGLLRARKQLGVSLDSYASFAFVRHPWDRLVSWYGLLRSKGAFAEFDPAAGFERYVIEGLESGKLPPAQVSYLGEEAGELHVKHWGRFESLETDLVRILGGLGIESARLPRVNAGPVETRSELYTEELRSLVARHYAVDFEAFGYSADVGRPGD